MKPRTPEQLTAIEKAMEDPRGAALALFTLAMVVGGERDMVPMRQTVAAAAEVVDDLFDRLAGLNKQPAPEEASVPLAPARCWAGENAGMDMLSMKPIILRCILPDGHDGCHKLDVLDDAGIAELERDKLAMKQRYRSG